MSALQPLVFPMRLVYTKMLDDFNYIRQKHHYDIKVPKYSHLSVA